MSRFLDILRNPKQQLQALGKGAPSHRKDGQRHFEAGQFEEAEASLLLALEEGGGSATRRIELLLQLAESQRQLAKLREAEEHSRKALAIAREAKNDELHVLALNTLNEVLMDRRDFAAAQKTLEEAIQADAKRKADVPRLTARRLRHLGIVFHQLGRHDDSIAKFTEAATLYEKHFGELHNETGLIRAELGAAYRAQGKYKESEECFTRALRIHEKCKGRQSAEALRDLWELAQTMVESGDLKRAITEYERALSLQESVIGGTFEQLAEIKLALAGLYADTGKLGRAQELLIHAVAGLKSSNGPNLAIAHEALAHVHESLGRVEDALTHLKHAAAVWQKLGRTEELVANEQHREELAAQMPKEAESRR